MSVFRSDRMFAQGDSFSELFPNLDKLILAALGLLVSIGSKHIKDDVNDVFEHVFKNIFMRRFMVFAVAYVYSNDISASIVVTIIFIMIIKMTQKSQEVSLSYVNKEI